MPFLDSLYERLKAAFPGTPADIAGLHAYLSANQPGLYGSLMEFRTQYEAWHFITNDKDLRLKAPDIWKAQLDIFGSSMDDAWVDLVTTCDEKGCLLEGLDPRALPDWMAFLSDFSFDAD